MKLYNNVITYAIGLGIVIAVRLMPHPPNVEPIMATMMPFAKKWGWFSGMLFSMLAIVTYDALTATIGLWTAITASTYAIIGLSAGVYFSTKNTTAKQYVAFAIIATIVYDAITGIGMGVLLFEQAVLPTVIGQIPFTLYHLMGNIAFAYVISPLLYTWIINNPELQTLAVWRKLTSA